MRAAARRLARAMTLVNRLSFTTVVYSSGPVTPWMWNDDVAVLAPEAEVLPHPRGLDEDVDRPAGEVVPVAGGLDVLHEGVRDVGVDVVLRRAGRVVGGRLEPVDGAPREQGAALVELGRPVAGGVEHPLPEPQGVPRHVRRRVASGTGARRSRCPRSSGRRSRSPRRPSPRCRRRPCAPPPARAWNRFQRTACWISGWPSTTTSLRVQQSTSHSCCSTNIRTGVISRAWSRLRSQRSASSRTGTPTARVVRHHLRQAHRLALPGADAVHVLGQVVLERGRAVPRGTR